ncbi:hypothetical protein THIX_40058 [Thiomonas sp. X19]|nr:hypothetical protein THIX_40058 [Thiomonas sp. X19]
MAWMPNPRPCLFRVSVDPFTGQVVCVFNFRARMKEKHHGYRPMGSLAGNRGYVRPLHPGGWMAAKADKGWRAGNRR